MPELPVRPLPKTIAGDAHESGAAPAVRQPMRAAHRAAGPPHRTAMFPEPARREARARATAVPPAQRPSTTAQQPWVHPGSGGANTAASCVESAANFSVAARALDRACAEAAHRVDGRCRSAYSSPSAATWCFAEAAIFSAIAAGRSRSGPSPCGSCRWPCVIEVSVIP